MIILIEHHHPACSCSYCEDTAHLGGGNLRTKLHYGLNIAQDWRRGWWVTKYWPQRYLRMIWSWRWSFRYEGRSQWPCKPS